MTIDPKKLEDVASNMDQAAAAIRADLSPTPSPQSSRERLLAGLPTHTEEPTTSWDCAQWPALCQLVNDGLVNIYFNGSGRPFGFRLAPPVEVVDLANLELAWHVCTAAQKYEEAVACRDAIAFVRRRTDLDVSEVNAELLEAAKAMVAAFRAEPAMQNRKYDGLGIRVNNAIARAEAASKPTDSCYPEEPK